MVKNLSENATGADNQQERPVAIQESSETTRQTPLNGEDIVPSAWRHAGFVIKENQSVYKRKRCK
jgi:hypothetical protein